MHRDVEMAPPHLPPGYEENWVYLNRFQNRYKRFDRGMDLHRVRMMRSYYYACISFIDFQVGRLLDALDETGQTENTLIVFSADHGELLGDFGSVGKRTYHDAASRIPMIVQWPGSVPAGKVSETPVSLLEVTKTLLEAGETAMETHACEGKSLVETANAADGDRTIFTQLYNQGRGLYTAVNRQWKYVYSAPDQRELLFDRQADPGETTDLTRVDSAPAADGMAAMKPQLIHHLRDLGEADALEGDDWKTYPKLTVSDDPDSDLLYQDHKWAVPLQHIDGYNAPEV
jgi:arylsulfatase A-like enzyme